MRGKLAIRVVGWFGFLPFLVSPQLWMAWHNRVHHNHTGKAGTDPDMYPTLHEYETQASARIMADHFGLGRKRLMSLLSLLFGFTGQSQQMLWTARKKGMLTAKLHRRAIAETLLGAVFWAGIAYLVGPRATFKISDVRVVNRLWILPCTLLWGVSGASASTPRVRRRRSLRRWSM